MGTLSSSVAQKLLELMLAKFNQARSHLITRRAQDCVRSEQVTDLFSCDCNIVCCARLKMAKLIAFSSKRHVIKFELVKQSSYKAELGHFEVIEFHQTSSRRQGGENAICVLEN